MKAQWRTEEIEQALRAGTLTEKQARAEINRVVNNGAVFRNALTPRQQQEVVDIILDSAPEFSTLLEPMKTPSDAVLASAILLGYYCGKTGDVPKGIPQVFKDAFGEES